MKRELVNRQLHNLRKRVLRAGVKNNQLEERLYLETVATERVKSRLENLRGFYDEVRLRYMVLYDAVADALVLLEKPETSADKIRRKVKIVSEQLRCSLGPRKPIWAAKRIERESDEREG